MPARRLTIKRRARKGARKTKAVRSNRARRTTTTSRVSDKAVVTEAFETPITTDGNGLYSNVHTYALSDFQRAQEVAHAYKYYRATKVELMYVPYATMSLTNGALASRMPQLYFTVDRVGNMFINPTESEMNERGVLPKLFKRSYKFSFKPNLLQNVQLETSQPTDGQGLPLGIDAINAINSVPLYNKWLPTQQSYGYSPQPPNQQVGTTQKVIQSASNPYALKYYGAVSVIDIENAGVVEAIGDLFTKITWEFKGPRALKTDAPSEQLPESPATSMIIPGQVANTQPTTYP